ncbi:helix-turn-helix domain-containing protein, partial [Embleya sp. NPDC005575]|uniref:helix-turn-helix transcriptional regulator n=1 Tax=Embleya sp. NPDC005575 TaxID=3156892 RepID=UPI0033BAC0DF
MSDSLFDAVDALLAQAQGDLPPPAERTRLRKAAGFTQQQVADALGVTRVTVVGWEAGRTEPRPPQRPAYARLLEGLAERYPATHPTPAADTAAAALSDRGEPVPDEPGPTDPEPQAPVAPAPDSTATSPAAATGPVVTAAAPWTRTPTTPPAAAPKPPRAAS